MAVRVEILRNYYESSFDGLTRDRYRGATFGEFVELVRIAFPGTTPASARQLAAAQGRPDLARSPIAPARSRDPEPLWEDPDLEKLARNPPHVFIQNSGKVDLSRLLAGTRARILTAHKNVVRGWNGLAEGDRWLHIQFYSCKTSDHHALDRPQACQHLVVSGCDDGCLHVLLTSTRCKIVRVVHRARVDLGLLRGHSGLESLYVDAPLVHGGGRLDTRSLRKLSVIAIGSFAELRPVVRASAARLERLEVGPAEPFLPGDLGKLPRLRRLSVRAYPQLRSEWIDFAVAHPQTRVEFVRLAETKTTARSPLDRPPRANRDQASYFDTWVGHVSPEVLRAARVLVGRAMRGIQDERAAPLAVLRACVEGFNALDAKYHFITTIEAEDIVAAIDRLAAATALGPRRNLADEWRNW
jgi:hypothetical protein